MVVMVSARMHPTLLVAIHTDPTDGTPLSMHTRV